MIRPPWLVTTSWQRPSNFSTRSPILSRSISLDSAVKDTRSAKPTVTSTVCRSSSLAPIASIRATAAARWRRQA